MKQIGEFAKDNTVTVKALRHYEKLGLVLPAKVDEFTGYRYYSESQSDILDVITYLKSLGFSLSEVKKIVTGEITVKMLSLILRAKKKQAKTDIDSSNVRYKRINALIKSLESRFVSNDFDIKEIINMENKDIKLEMTGHELFNYEARNMMDAARENDTPLCVLSIDIDDFAAVNDKFGYEVGDVVIERTQNAVQQALMEINTENRDGYSMLERDAGDEFKIVLNDDVDIAKKLASLIIEMVFAIDYGDIQEGLSRSVTIGVASNECEKMSMGKLFHLADSAMYEAKNQKRGTYVVYTQ